MKAAVGALALDGMRVALHLDSQDQIVFRHAGDELIAQEWDRAVWGEEGSGVLLRVR